MTKFRFVLTDDEDNILEVLYESKEYDSRWCKEFSDDEYHTLLNLDATYNFYDYDNCPNIILEYFENGKWKYDTSAVEYYYNL